MKKTEKWNLTSLRKRHKLKHNKRKPEVKVGKVVLIKGNQRSKAQSKLGIITEVYILKKMAKWERSDWELENCIWNEQCNTCIQQNHSSYHVILQHQPKSTRWKEKQKKVKWWNCTSKEQGFVKWWERRTFQWVINKD